MAASTKTPVFHIRRIRTANPRHARLTHHWRMLRQRVTVVVAVLVAVGGISAQMLLAPVSSQELQSSLFGYNCRASQDIDGVKYFDGGFKSCLKEYQDASTSATRRTQLVTIMQSACQLPIPPSRPDLAQSVTAAKQTDWCGQFASLIQNAQAKTCEEILEASNRGEVDGISITDADVSRCLAANPATAPQAYNSGLVRTSVMSKEEACQMDVDNAPYLPAESIRAIQEAVGLQATGTWVTSDLNAFAMECGLTFDRGNVVTDTPSPSPAAPVHTAAPATTAKPAATAPAAANGGASTAASQDEKLIIVRLAICLQSGREYAACAAELGAGGDTLAGAGATCDPAKLDVDGKHGSSTEKARLAMPDLAEEYSLDQSGSSTCISSNTGCIVKANVREFQAAYNAKCANNVATGRGTISTSSSTSQANNSAPLAVMTREDACKFNIGSAMDAATESITSLQTAIGAPATGTWDAKTLQYFSEMCPATTPTQHQQRILAKVALALKGKAIRIDDPEFFYSTLSGIYVKYAMLSTVDGKLLDAKDASVVALGGVKPTLQFLLQNKNTVLPPEYRSAASATPTKPQSTVSSAREKVCATYRDRYVASLTGSDAVKKNIANQKYNQCLTSDLEYQKAQSGQLPTPSAGSGAGGTAPANLFR